MTLFCYYLGPMYNKLQLAHLYFQTFYGPVILPGYIAMHRLAWLIRRFLKGARLAGNSIEKISLCQLQKNQISLHDQTCTACNSRNLLRLQFQVVPISIIIARATYLITDIHACKKIQDWRLRIFGPIQTKHVACCLKIIN